MPRRASGAIRRVLFQPPDPRIRDVELLSFAELKRRATLARLRLPERLGFYMVLCVVRGRCRHEVDFERHAGAAGSWFVLRPGQVQRYDLDASWDGELLIFAPELFAPALPRGSGEQEMQIDLAPLSSGIALSRQDHSTCLMALQQMAKDSRSGLSDALTHSLLRHQVYALLRRLQLAQRHSQQRADIAAAQLHRFRRFSALVERHFATQHQVRAYATALGCSEKSLGRATQDVAGLGAKAFLNERIVLEAKRLLAHTAFPVSSIATQLGFGEATNFVKFFRRATDETPTDFRRRYAGDTSP